MRDVIEDVFLGALDDPARCPLEDQARLDSGPLAAGARLALIR